MSSLWLAAMALLVLALLLLVPPLLQSPAASGAQQERRRQRARWAELQQQAPEERAQAEDDLLRAVLDDAGAEPAQRAPRWAGPAAALALTVILPTATLALYLQAGDPRAAAALSPQAAPPDSHADASGGPEAAVARLAARLQAQPQDLAGWAVLARSYETLQRFDDAAAAWQRAIALAPQEARLHADLADALASARDGDLGGPAGVAIAAALALDPNDPKALALARAAELQRAGAQPALRVSGRVAVAEALRARVLPQDTVFIVARELGGPAMPVAVLRLRGADLPADFVLDERNVLDPARPLAQAKALTLELRVTRARDAARQPGDLLAAPRAVRLGAQQVELVADEVAR